MIYNCDYCVCKNPVPEEIKRGVVICLECNRKIELPDEQPEDMSTCEDLVGNDNADYEQERYEVQTGDISSHYQS